MTNGNDRLDRIEGILDRVAARQEEMSARQQYHDEAFERHDAQLKTIIEAITVDGEHIRALVRVAELHSRRPEHLEGGEAA
jgi:C4-type Zn-finger protein